MKMSLRQNWMPLEKNLSWMNRRRWTSRCWTLAHRSVFPTFLRPNLQDQQLLQKHLGKRRKILTWLSWLRGPLSGSKRELGGVEVTVMRESDNLHFVEAPYSHHLCQAGVVIRWGDSCDFVICFPFLDTIYQCFNKAYEVLFDKTFFSKICPEIILRLGCGRAPHSQLGNLHHGQAVRKSVFGRVFRLPERRSIRPQDTPPQLRNYSNLSFQ